MLALDVVDRHPFAREMGLAHGGLRQKCFNTYEETMRVPLVYSNPRLWSKPQTSDAMVSHVDMLPTLASLVRAPASARARWQGVDYSDLVLSRLAPPPQDYVVLTYDDWQVGQTSPPYVKPPQHIISVRERRWKIAEYYDVVHGKVPSEWEMYDLKRDPLERNNLASKGYHRTPAQEKEYRRLRRKLARVKAQRLRPATGHAPAPDRRPPQRAGPDQRDGLAAPARDGRRRCVASASSPGSGDRFAAEPSGRVTHVGSWGRPAQGRPPTPGSGSRTVSPGVRAVRIALQPSRGSRRSCCQSPIEG